MQSEDYLSQLEPIVQQLNGAAGGGGAGPKWDRRSLGLLVVGFLEFEEMALGIRVRGWEPWLWPRESEAAAIAPGRRHGGSSDGLRGGAAARACGMPPLQT